MKIYVKNMCCESCKLFVMDALEELNIVIVKIELGEIETKEDVSDENKKQLNIKLNKAGLELLEKKKGVLIDKIKNVAMDYVNKSEGNSNIKFSHILSDQLKYNYTYLGNLFSEVETTTPARYIVSLKIGRIKELIIFGEDTLVEIAHKLNYSSAAHLSTQFKKSTGLTPLHFKNLKEKPRITIEKI